MEHDPADYSLPLDHESPAERRIDQIGRSVFERAVSQAAEIATQNVAQIHRHRLVVQSFLAALVCSALLGLMLAFIFKAQVENSQHRDAVAECNLIKRLAQPLSDFVTSDANLRQEQGKVTPGVQRALGRVLGKGTLSAAEKQAALINEETTHYWLTSVVPRLGAIGGVTCSHLSP